MAATALPTRRLRDADLISTEFRFVDPETTISGLNRGIPDPEANPVIIGYYDETPPGGRKANPSHPFIWCCHCGKPTHWVGRVVRDDKGETYIIGATVCGRNHYGDRFDTAENAFRAERERRRTLLRWRNAVQLLAKYRHEVNEILAWSGLSQLELKRDEFRRASPTGVQRLLRFIGTGTEMIAYRDERDEAAEQERDRKFDIAMTVYRKLPSEQRRSLRDDGLAPEADDSQIWHRMLEPLGFVAGGDFLRPDCDARARGLELRKTLDSIAAIEAGGTDAADTGTMLNLLQNLKDQTAQLRDTVHDLAFAELFFSPDNLDRLEKWSRRDPRCNWSRKGSAILVDDSSKGLTRIEPIGNLAPPRCDALQLSRHLDDSFVVPLDLAA